MKCPKCGFISFDYLDSCKRCNADLDGARTLVGLAGLQVAQAGVLLESSGAGVLRDAGPEFVFSESGEAEDTGFQFEEPRNEELSPVVDAENLDLGEEPIFDLKEEDEEIQEIQLDVSELEEELMFEPELNLGSTDDSLGDMEFELDIPLDETAPATVQREATKRPPSFPAESGKETEDEKSFFDLPLDLDEDTAEPAGGSGESAKAALRDEGPDLDLSELELDSGFGPTLDQAPEPPVGKVSFAGEGELEELDLDLDLQEPEPIQTVADRSAGPFRVSERPEDEEQEIFALDLDDELSLELESDDLSGKEPGAQGVGKAGGGLGAQIRPLDLPGDLGADSLEDLSLEALGRDEIFQKQVDSPGARVKEDATLEKKEDPEILDLDSSEDDFEALARDFENGIKELEKEEHNGTGRRVKDDDDLYASIPDLDHDTK